MRNSEAVSFRVASAWRLGAFQGGYEREKLSSGIDGPADQRRRKTGQEQGTVGHA